MVSLYERLEPNATYAPWLADNRFLITYKTLAAYTLVDIYRCWELWTLAKQTSTLKGNILEVGVWRGGTGVLLAKNSGTLVYLCDTFTGVVKAGEYDSHYTGGEHSDANQCDVEELLAIFGIENTKILNGVFPDETAACIPPYIRFRLCHIDVDTYQSAKDIMDWVWPRLVVGGVVVYDDYGFDKCSGVTRHVNELTDRLVLYNLNGHAIVIKIKESNAI